MTPMAAALVPSRPERREHVHANGVHVAIVYTRWELARDVYDADADGWHVAAAVIVWRTPLVHVEDFVGRFDQVADAEARFAALCDDPAEASALLTGWAVRR